MVGTQRISYKTIFCFGIVGFSWNRTVGSEETLLPRNEEAFRDFVFCYNNDTQTL
jgi:hypothetical protein